MEHSLRADRGREEEDRGTIKKRRINRFLGSESVGACGGGWSGMACVRANDKSDQRTPWKK